MNGSRIYTSILIPNLILGVPRSWLGMCGLIFTVIYYFANERVIGGVMFLFTYVIGYLLTKYYDPDFANIIVEKMRNLNGTTFIRPKIYHD